VAVTTNSDLSHFKRGPQQQQLINKWISKHTLDIEASHLYDYFRDDDDDAFGVIGSLLLAAQGHHHHRCQIPFRIDPIKLDSHHSTIDSLRRRLIWNSRIQQPNDKLRSFSQSLAAAAVTTNQKKVCVLIRRRQERDISQISCFACYSKAAQVNKLESQQVWSGFKLMNHMQNRKNFAPINKSDDWAAAVP